MNYTILPFLPERVDSLNIALESVYRQKVPSIRLVLIVNDFAENQATKLKSLKQDLDQQYPASPVAKTPWVIEYMDGRKNLSTCLNVGIKAVEQLVCATLPSSSRCKIANSLVSEQLAEQVFVSFLDDDDYWHQDYLEQINKQILLHPKACVFAGSINRIDANFPQGRETCIKMQSFSSPSFLIENPGIQGSNLTVRLSTLNKVKGFNEQLDSCTDRDICLRLLEQGCQFRSVPKAIAFHNALAFTPRLSDKGSKKVQELYTFFERWKHLSDPKIRKAFRSNVNKKFGSKKAFKGQRSQLIVAVLSTQPELLDRLLKSTCRLDDTKFEVTVLVFANAPGFELKAQRCFPHNLKVYYSQHDRTLDIASARNAFNSLLNNYLECLAVKPLVWMLDEDNILSAQVNTYLPLVLSMKSNQDADVLIGSIEGDSPNAASLGMASQLSDLAFNLDWLDGLLEGQVPDKSDHNQQNRLEHPDYYYDLSSLNQDTPGALVGDFYIEPEDPQMTALDCKAWILSQLDSLSYGKNLFRPIQVENFEPYESLHRGGNTFILNPECLKVKQPEIKNQNKLVRRSDMMWCLAGVQMHGWKVLKVPYAVEHRRNYLENELNIDKTIKDIMGSLIFNALRAMSNEGSGSFQDVVRKLVDQKKEKIAWLFEAVNQAIDKLKQRSEPEVIDLIKRVEQFFQPSHKLALQGNLDEFAASPNWVIKEWFEQAILVEDCLLIRKEANLFQYALAGKYSQIKLYANRSLRQSFHQEDSSSDVIVRMHSSCHNSEVMGAVDCDCAAQLKAALASIEQHDGLGLVFYLDQEGRGHGYEKKVAIVGEMQRTGCHTYDACANLGLASDQRHYDLVVQLLGALGIDKVRLLSNNPKKVQALTSAGLKVQQAPLFTGMTSATQPYIESKLSHGHRNLSVHSPYFCRLLEQTQGEVKFYDKDEQPYGAFSNVARQYPISIETQNWLTVEHYYQAQKFMQYREIQDEIRYQPDPIQAKAIAKSYEHLLDETWNKQKIHAMYTGLYAKFSQHLRLRKLLLSSGQAYLIENAQDDDYWGAGADGSGHNMLGKLLVFLRSQL